jgi:hypothetical protein
MAGLKADLESYWVEWMDRKKVRYWDQSSVDKSDGSMAVRLVGMMDGYSALQWDKLQAVAKVEKMDSAKVSEKVVSLEGEWDV